MRLARFIHSGNQLEGSVKDDHVVDLSSGERFQFEEVTWLPPCVPSKIIGLVLNYRDHADELGLSVVQEPVIFLKPPSSLIGHLGQIVFPEGTKYMHYEGELCVIIGKPARKVAANNAMHHVKGYTIANDVTVRDFITNTFRPPVKAKGFDTFCPVGPFLVTPDEAGDIAHLEIKTTVNGETRQKGNTSDLMHAVPEIIEYLSDFMTLLPGDMILTGTPKGISPIYPGDTVSIEISNLGRLVSTIVPEARNN